MKKEKIVYLTLLSIALIAVSCEKNTKEERPDFPLEQPYQVDEEDYELYSLVINEKYSSEKIVIAQNSTAHVALNYRNSFYEEIKENNPNFDTTLVESLNALNDTSILFGENFISDSKQIIVISSEELSYIFNGQDANSGWDAFYQAYENSNGIIRFTRIAYNEDKTQAILEMGHSFASLGASGKIVYFEKQNGNWTIANTIPTWIS